jgi:hypothetical protein
LPQARQRHAMGYDALRLRTVLFGGSVGTTKLADLWEWDGIAWTAAPAPTNAWGPEARSGHTLAYDARNERIVVYGGDTASGCASDAWSWNGTAWTLHLPTGSAPSARSGAQLFAQTGTNQLLLFAGGCGTNLTNDLWQLDIPVAARFLSYGAGCAPLSGNVPLLSQVPNTNSRVGQTLGIRISNLPSILTVTIPFFGFSNTQWNLVPLPAPLAAYGMPGCTLYADPISTGFAFAFTGSVDWNIAIPNNPSLAGLSLYFQSLIVDPAAGNPFGGVVTNAARAVVGS